MKLIFKSVLFSALAASLFSTSALAAKDLGISEFAPLSSTPCSFSYYIDGTPTRGRFEIIQYNFVGTFENGQEVVYRGDSGWFYTPFQWTLLGRRIKHRFYGINGPKPEKFEIVFYNGQSQFVIGSELLRIDISDQCNANTPPVSHAGEDIKYGIPYMQVYLDGSQSSDDEGDELSYSWTQISGPEVELIDGDTATPSFYYPPGRADQVIEFELVVNDGTDDSEPDTVTVIHNGRSNGKANGRK